MSEIVVPLVDLRAQYRSLKPEIDAAVIGVLESGQYVLGPEVAAFEQEFAAYCQAAHAVAVNSGTSALHLSLIAAGVGPGDEVITVPFTFIATAAAVSYAGGRPVFVDVEPRSLNMDPARLEAAITDRTRAIIPVHLYGQPADMGPILEIARRRGLTVIEDAAQAHGALYGERPVGSIGHLGCFSFYPSKNLGAFGEAGLITTNDADLAATLRTLRDWGQHGRYNHVRLGFNYRMEALQGAMLRVKLRHLPAWIEARRALAAEYDRLLADVGIHLPERLPYGSHVFYVYSVRLQERDAFRDHMRDRGIETGVHYPVPLHLQPAYRDLGYQPGAFPVSEQAAREIISLPMFPEMTLAQVRAVADAVHAFRRVAAAR
jgi:dTDP-4-amino-4,6-dideoxygalactose transaminase